MKKILGLDLGTNSIGWALVNEAETESEESSIVKMGVRVNPLTVDELTNFEKGKSITTNADRTLKRSARRNLQRYKLRRDALIKILKSNKLLTSDSILSEEGNKTTFETYRLRAIAVTGKISLEEFGRVLLMINKKRGYKSSRKAKSPEEGQLIDGMEIAKKMYEQNLTPGQFVLELLKDGKKYIPDFYRSDLQAEFDRIWNFQKQFFPNILTDEFKTQISGKGKLNTSKIFLGRYGIYTAENKGADKKKQTYIWRVDALSKQLTKEEVAFVISDLNGIITSSSGYLGAISDRSKELHFNKQTVGQYLMSQLEKDPNFSLKNKVFYRQDYLDEFNTLWETQSKFHKELTEELKSEIRDVVIFYQRRLKSQKGLISFCELENKQIVVEKDGKKKTKTIGLRVCPKSSPLFQEFKIWQILNNIEVKQKRGSENRLLNQEEKELLFDELSIKEKQSKDQALKILFKNYKELDLNYKNIEGDKTQFAFFQAYQQIVENTGHGEYDFSSMNAAETLELVQSVFHGLGYKTDFLTFNSGLEGKDFEFQPFYKLWHLLYSFEGDNSKTGNEKLIVKIQELTGFDKEAASIVSAISLPEDYGSLCSKAMRKILPFMKEGNEYSLACEYAGYRHSKSSLTKEEKEKKELRDKLEILPKNSLRNPVVEKILNQMVNVVNSVVENFEKPDEIRIELARDLKKSSKEREDLTKAINKSTAEHEEIKQILAKEFGFSHISRNDIIRYKLYIELEPCGFKTLYSNTYIPREKLFSKDFDIEHIIPQSRLFDDSFSNKTLETRSINIEKGNETAIDFVLSKYGQKGVEEYLDTLDDLFSSQKISRAKYNKLKMKGADIPEGFIQRDLRDTQYIAKKAKSILEELVKDVISTTGSITDRLREDWQLIDVMQELNWEKYDKLGLTEIIENREGHKIRRIKDWTKRNDHRHHAMDALTIAFTKLSHIQYLNNLNARSDKSGSIYGIEQKELYRDTNGKIKFKPPIPLPEFRAEAKKHLENTLISIKAKNKVVTKNINCSKTQNGEIKKTQLTPRGQLHLETVYGSIKQYTTQELKVGAAFTEEQILKVAKKSYRDALLARLREFDNDPKKAFTGKNSLDKNPLWIDKLQTQKVPEKVKIVGIETIYSIRKEISPDLKIDKVIDAKVKAVLEARLLEFNGDSKKAFSNLDENPIWLNKEKRIAIKRVTITGVSNAQALHDKKDKNGNLLFDENGKKQPVDFVNTGNNHHVAVYRDENGNLQENVISFFEATARATQGLPAIDKDFNKDKGWQFLFSMKQNEYFVFPNEQTGFNPNEIDLLNPENYNLISPNLFRVQKFGSLLSGFWFRYHLETTVNISNELKGITYKVIQSTKNLEKIIKVRINHIGQIISVGEY
ncbi:MAG: type II CRISPR RNA-guided endonuclease Cas9 [Prolixibacteraceae bacterium]|nr:type II CRISPR RNA-guided endonuclease Cas9 [Prolixibacteraceae bacterium]